MKRFGLCFVLAILVSAAMADSGWTRYRVFSKNAQDVQRLVDSDLSLFSEDVALGGTDYAVGPKEIYKLWKLGLSYQFISELPDPYNWIGQRLDDGTDYRTSFFTFTEIINKYEEWRAANGRMMTRSQIATTINGRPVWAYRIYNNALSDLEIPRKSIIITGAIHAREWISPSVVMYITDSILQQLNTPGSPMFNKLADKCALYVVPVLNPDGYEWTWTDYRMWRKNRRPNTGGSFGVDLNRNWAKGWGGQGSSGTPSSDTYRGTAPWSEPEIDAMRVLTLAAPNLMGFIDFHSYGQHVLYPWSYTTTTIPDQAQHQSVGDAVKNAIFSVYGTSFDCGQGSTTLYIASGTSKDHVYDVRDCPSYTFELRDTGQNGFILPTSQITPSQNELWEGFKAFINALLP